MIIAGLLFFATAVALLVRAFALPRVRMSDQVRQIRAYGFEAETGVEPELERSSLVADAERIGEAVGRFMRELLPALKPLTRGQLAAGGVTRLSPDTVHGYRTIAAVGLPTLLLFLAIAGHNASAVTILIALLLGPIVWLLPAAAIRRRGRLRLDKIDRELPE